MQLLYHWLYSLVSCGVDVAEDLGTVFEEVGDVPMHDFENGVKKKIMLSDMFDEDDKLMELKMLVKMQEWGISIEYCFQLVASVQIARMLQRLKEYPSEKKVKTRR